ncbi:MAG: glycosyltransferase family 4 protein [Candidatus Pacearchaeota archaeon]
MKILELTNFSSGICGVWTRAKQESIEFSKIGHEVLVISSNAIKGSNKIAKQYENLGKVKIMRFPYIKLGGESFMYWFRKEAEKAALKFSPDVIIAHNYRHLHTTKALEIKKTLERKGKRCRVFLVTHAPFVEGNITRTKLQTFIVNFYDKFIGPLILNKFDRIIAISKWEIPYLIKCRAKKEKIIYIPNTIPDEFFKLKRQSKEENKILFLGRISPKKKIETVLCAIPFIKNKEVKFEIVGPAEENYKDFLLNLIQKLKIQRRVVFSSPVYDLKEKIKKLDSAKIFILPSRVEGMPQALIEAMARKKVVIGSDSIAIRDLIKNGYNGYLFEFNDPTDLASKIDLILSKDNSKLKQNAFNSAKNFCLSKFKNKLRQIIK